MLPGKRFLDHPLCLLACQYGGELDPLVSSAAPSARSLHLPGLVVALGNYSLRYDVNIFLPNWYICRSTPDYVPLIVSGRVAGALLAETCMT
jgi:hypothetical protein